MDAADIAIWLEKYNRARQAFVGGAISYIEAMDALRNLRYRHDALKSEMQEWERLKRVRKHNHLRVVRKKLRKYIDEPGSVTIPSSE